MLKTIKSTLSAINSIAIITASVVVLALSIKVHESLYLESVKGDLDGLSENMAYDMVQYLGQDDPDLFGILTALLRLERYENVKYAIVFDANDKQVQQFFGPMASPEDQDELSNKTNFDDYELGMSVQGNDLISFKIVGEKSLPLGKVLIVNDLYGPLNKSKRDLLQQVFPIVSIIVLIGILILRWLNQRLLSPFSHLAKLAHRIKQTNDYAIDINVKGKQEVQDLTQEFGEMMQTINKEGLKNQAYTEQLQQQRKDMERLANFDSLTGLPNRHFFMSILANALNDAAENDLNPALMYIDLDGFKDVNDTYGHHVGDSLLIKVSERILSHLDYNDKLARLGGDEFLVMLSGSPQQSDIEILAQKVIKDLAEVYRIEEWEVNISASIGIAFAESASCVVSNFIGNADVAMYRSKVDGKNTYTLFSSDMMEGNLRKLKIASSLLSAVKNDEFQLFYQPKVDNQHQIVGFEALIRWTNDELGFVPPDEFINIAEKSGRIHLVTSWVIERACKDVNILREKFGKDIVLSLNLSSVDLKLPNLADSIQALFDQYKVVPQSMEFEVTESAYLENFDEASSFFERIEKMGCSIALDDFGTGYSSLSYLTQITINTLKIDKQFVDQIGISERDTLITKTIIEMAKQLNLNICAEGVETLDQATFLLAAGCQNLQGYYFGRPTKLVDLLIP